VVLFRWFLGPPGTPMAKADLWAVTDAEERKGGEQTGLDTLVVHPVNVGN